MYYTSHKCSKSRPFIRPRLGSRPIPSDFDVSFFLLLLHIFNNECFIHETSALDPVSSTFALFVCEQSMLEKHNETHCWHLITVNVALEIYMKFFLFFLWMCVCEQMKASRVWLCHFGKHQVCAAQYHVLLGGSSAVFLAWSGFLLKTSWGAETFVIITLHFCDRLFSQLVVWFLCSGGRSIEPFLK